MLKWPSRSGVAIRKLFETLQDIDIYVEDTNDEAFYRALLKSVIKNEIKIERVFALNGRDNVIHEARIHDQQKRRALFIIDGDLSWVKGDPIPSVIGLHCHNAYCIENLIICEKALALILSQEAAITEEDAYNLLAYNEWVDSITSHLIELFAAFATAYEHAVPKIKTVSKGVEPMCSKPPNGKKELDPAKVATVKEDVIKAAENTAGTVVAYATYEQVLCRIKNLQDSLDAVSGKDFLIPLIEVHLKSLGYQIKRKSLRIRLAGAADMARFDSLANALRQAARGYGTKL